LNGIRWFGRLTIFVAESLPNSPTASHNTPTEGFQRNFLSLAESGGSGQGLWSAKIPSSGFSTQCNVVTF
jgi:hypothetical protein